DVVEGEEAPHVRERVRHRSAVVEPGGGVADVAEIRAGGVEVVPHRDAVQVVDAALIVDDGAGARIVQDRNDELPREGDAYGGGGPVRRNVLLVDLLDRDQQAQTVILDRGGRAVDEPDLVPLRIEVARHVAGVHDVVEDEQEARGVVSVPADV